MMCIRYGVREVMSSQQRSQPRWLRRRNGYSLLDDLNVVPADLDLHRPGVVGVIRFGDEVVRVCRRDQPVSAVGNVRNIQALAGQAPAVDISPTHRYTLEVILAAGDIGPRRVVLKAVVHRVAIRHAEGDLAATGDDISADGTVGSHIPKLVE